MEPKERLKEQVDQRSTQAGQQVNTVADDVRTVAGELRNQGKDKPAQYAEQAAERVQNVGQWLERSDGDQILRGVEGRALPRFALERERSRRHSDRAARPRVRWRWRVHPPGGLDGHERTADMTAPDNDMKDRSTGELLKELSNETTTLVKQEIELMKAELAEKARPAGIGAGMFGGAG